MTKAKNHISSVYLKISNPGWLDATISDFEDTYEEEGAKTRKQQVALFEECLDSNSNIWLDSHRDSMSENKYWMAVDNCTNADKDIMQFFHRKVAQ
jgi:hypothetical protein